MLCCHKKVDAGGQRDQRWELGDRAVMSALTELLFEVKLYCDQIYGMLVQEMENISGSKARSVARTTSIEMETSDASTVWDACNSRVAGVALHLSEAL